MRLRPLVLPLLLVLLACAGGCGRRARLIPERKLVRIYSDIFLVDQWFRDNPEKRMTGDTTLVFDPIFRRYGYTFEDYDRSVHYYLDRPDKFNKIVTQVSERLRAEGNQIDFGSGQFDGRDLHGFADDQEPFHAGCESDAADGPVHAGQVQFVTAPAGDRILSAQTGMGEFKDRMHIIVQSPDQTRFDGEIDIPVRKNPAYLIKIFA